MHESRKTPSQKPTMDGSRNKKQSINNRKPTAQTTNNRWLARTAGTSQLLISMWSAAAKEGRTGIYDRMKPPMLIAHSVSFEGQGKVLVEG
jgi:hypothetical protein